MRPSSAKAKGRRLQQWVRDTLLKFAPSLQPDDIRSTSMGAGGEDLLLSPAARAVYPFSIECKNQEALNIWSALEQAEGNSEIFDYPGRVPVVVFKRNKSKTYVALDFETFIRLTQKG